MVVLARRTYFLLTSALLLLSALSCASDNPGCPECLIPPSPPSNLQVVTESRALLLTWDFQADVSQTLSFSGYKIFTRTNGEDFFRHTTDLQIRPASSDTIPDLIKRQHSLADDRMEIRLTGLRPFFQTWTYVVGIQNGNRSAPSDTIMDIPYRRTENIRLQEVTRPQGLYYSISENTPDQGALTEDVIGYRSAGEDYLLFRSADLGGYLRLLKGGAELETENAPDSGYISDGEIDRIQIEAGDWLFIQNTKGTDETTEDDNFSRIRIRLIDGKTAINIDRDYQIREGARNL